MFHIVIMCDFTLILTTATKEGITSIAAIIIVITIYRKVYRSCHCISRTW